ncbi:MAG: hypothetical protein R3C05_17055 [Pirellulaceae bacterium]
MSILERQAVIVQRTQPPLISGPLIDELKQIRAWISSGGAPVESDQFLPIMVGYVSDISDARSKTFRSVNILISSLERGWIQRSSEKVGDAYNELGGILDATDVLTAGTRWHGNRFYDAATTGPTIGFWFEKVEKNQCIGRIERDLGFSNHPIHRMSSTINGGMVVVRTLEQIQPGRRTDDSLVYTGYVIGRTIIGTFVGSNPRGKAVKGSFRVALK